MTNRPQIIYAIVGKNMSSVNATRKVGFAWITLAEIIHSRQFDLPGGMQEYRFYHTYEHKAGTRRKAYWLITFSF